MGNSFGSVKSVLLVHCSYWIYIFEKLLWTELTAQFHRHHVNHYTTYDCLPSNHSFEIANEWRWLKKLYFYLGIGCGCPTAKGIKQIHSLIESDTVDTFLKWHVSCYHSTRGRWRTRCAGDNLQPADVTHKKIKEKTNTFFNEFKMYARNPREYESC